MPCNKVVDGLTATAISNRLQLNSGDSGKPFADHVLSRADPASESVSKPGLSVRELVLRSAETWRDIDGRQKIHFSTQAPGKRPGAHADTRADSAWMCETPMRLDGRGVDGRDGALEAVAIRRFCLVSRRPAPRRYRTPGGPVRR